MVWVVEEEEGINRRSQISQSLVVDKGFPRFSEPGVVTFSPRPVDLAEEKLNVSAVVPRGRCVRSEEVSERSIGSQSNGAPGARRAPSGR